MVCYRQSYALASEQVHVVVHVLDHYINLVPKVEADGFLILRDGHTVPFDDTRFNVKLLGGDQLTVVRVRSTQSLFDTLDSAAQRCEGLVPVIENWHARAVLLQVSNIVKVQCTGTYCIIVCRLFGSGSIT